jgi:hypothetical protein
MPFESHCLHTHMHEGVSDEQYAPEIGINGMD